MLRLYLPTTLQIKVTARFLYSNLSRVRQWMIHNFLVCILYTVCTKMFQLLTWGVWKVYFDYLLLKDGVLSVFIFSCFTKFLQIWLVFSWFSSCCMYYLLLSFLSSPHQSSVIFFRGATNDLGHTMALWMSILCRQLVGIRFQRDWQKMMG